MEDKEDSQGDQPVQLSKEQEVVHTVLHDASRVQDKEGPPHDAVVHGDDEYVGHEEVGLDVDGAQGPPEVPGLGVLQQGQQPQGDGGGGTAHQACNVTYIIQQLYSIQSVSPPGLPHYIM